MSEKNGKKRILIVDDEADIRMLLARRLENWGYEILSAEDGEKALSVAGEQVPDLILLDTMMPKMKGRDVCVRLKATPKTKDIPVIFLTALNLADHIKAGLDVGAEDYIAKPYEAHDLKKRIQICLARHNSE